MIRGYFASLKPELPRPMWWIVAGSFISAIGNGFVLPFGTIYLHFVRGLPIAEAGLVVSTGSVGGLALNLLGGGLIDRFGARNLTVAGLTLQAAGTAMLAGAVNAPIAFAAMLVFGVGAGVFYPAQTTVVAELTTPQQRSGAAALQYALNNLGIGAGAVISGLIVSIEHPLTFVAVLLANAVSYIAFAALLLITVPADHGQRHRTAGESRLAGYAMIVRDRLFLGVVVLNGLFVLFGYAQLESNLTLYAKTYMGVSTAALGFAIAANTVFIVVAQLPIARAARAWSRIRSLAGAGCAWAVAWIVGMVATTTYGRTAALLFTVTWIVFAAGECLLSATLAPLLMDLSSSEHRGTYMGFYSLSWNIALLIGPAAGSVVIAQQHTAYWPLLFVSALFTLAFIGALSRRIPASANHPYRVVATPERT